MTFAVVQAGAAAFLASFVEFVEALTVILALVATRGWRGPMAGTAAALVVLALVAAIFGPALQALDTPWLRLAVGLLVLLFGLRWLRKAILRAIGIIPLHDETAAYARARSRFATSDHARGLDPVAFTGAFNVTLLEGSEVAFIVVAMGAGKDGLLAPGIGAAIALVLVAALGISLHRPLARIPENALKCAVGILLAAFGTFWTGEGIGVVWQAGDFSLVGLSLVWAALTWALIATARVAQ